MKMPISYQLGYRPMLVPLVGVVIGIVFYNYHALSMQYSFAFTISILLLLVTLQSHRHVPILKLLSIAFAWISIGYLLAATNDPRQYKSWYGHKASENGVWQMRILDEGKVKTYSTQYKAQVLSIRTASHWQASSGTILLSIPNDQQLAIATNDTLLVTTSLQPTQTNVSIGTFDYKTYLQHQQIFHTLYLNKQPYVLLKGSGTKNPFKKANHWAINKYRLHVKDASTRALLQAMILGDEQAIDPETRTRYADIGILHAVAISGGHIAALLLIITWLFPNNHHPIIKRLKLVVGLAMIWFYILMAGAPYSAVRSGLMYSVLFIGMIGNRPQQSINALLLTAFFMIAIDPNTIFQIGFQLSFIAVLSILLFFGPLCKWYLPKSFIGKSLFQMMYMSISAQLLLIPLLIYYFQQLPIYVVLSNLLSQLLMAAHLYGGFLILLSSPLPFVANSLASLLSGCSSILHYLTQFLHHLEPNWAKQLYLTNLQLVLAYLVLIFYLHYLQFRWRFALTATIASSILLVILKFTHWQTLGQQQVFAVQQMGKRQQIWLMNGRQLYTLSPQHSYDTISLRGIKAKHHILHHQHIHLDTGAYQIQTNKGSINILTANKRMPTSWLNSAYFIWWQPRFNALQLSDFTKGQHIISTYNFNGDSQSLTQPSIWNLRTDGAFIDNQSTFAR